MNISQNVIGNDDIIIIFLFISKAFNVISPCEFYTSHLIVSGYLISIIRPRILFTNACNRC